MERTALSKRTSARLMAEEAGYSVAQYYRRFQRETGERPIELRRRLRLERAAYQLTRSMESIASIAFRAGFESSEGFTRAFRRAFGVNPSTYRSLGPTAYRVTARSSIHFAPNDSANDPRQGEETMNVIDRLVGAHFEGMRLILDKCEELNDEQLDRPVTGYFDPLPWMSQNQTLRSLLQLTCGVADLPSNEVSVAGLRESLSKSHIELKDNIDSYEREKMWDMTFVDSDCDPPVVFSYGGWIGHVLVFLNHRRIACMMALSQIGVTGLAFFDPVDFSARNEPA